MLHFVSFAGLSFDLKIKKINEIRFKKKLNKNARPKPDLAKYPGNIKRIETIYHYKYSYSGKVS